MKINDRRQTPRPGPGRRRFPRLEVDGGLPIRDITANVSVEVMNISLGGFQTISSVDVEEGAEHTFEARLGADTVSINARVIHRQPGGGALPRYIVGWACATDAVTSRNIAALIGYLTSAESFAAAAPGTRLTRK
jgi:hypothetical protein